MIQILGYCAVGLVVLGGIGLGCEIVLRLRESRRCSVTRRARTR